MGRMKDKLLDMIEGGELEIADFNCAEFEARINEQKYQADKAILFGVLYGMPTLPRRKLGALEKRKRNKCK